MVLTSVFRSGMKRKNIFPFAFRLLIAYNPHALQNKNYLFCHHLIGFFVTLHTLTENKKKRNIKLWH